MKQTVSTKQAPAAIGPYAQAVRVGDFLFVSGQLGADPETGALEPDVTRQTRRALENLAAVLQAGSCTMADVVKTTVFLKDMNDFAAMNEVYASFFGDGGYPARSAVQVARLPRDGMVEIEAIAAVK
jgi:2-iminobutanoate/2-iminopropanoate deaminase